MPARLGLGCRAALALALVCSVQALHGLTGLGGWDSAGTFESALYTSIELAALVLVVVRAAGRRQDRLAWTMLAIYLVLWNVADVGWTFHYDLVDDAPIPNWTDGFYLSSYLFAYAGQTLLLRTRVRQVGVSLWLDGLIGGLAIAAVCAALVFGPILDASTGSADMVAVNLAYPAMDLVLLCVLGVAFGVLGWRPPRALLVLGLALGVAAVGDAAYCYQEAVGTYADGSWVNVTWPAGMTLTALAAWWPERRVARSPAVRSQFSVAAGFAAVALAVLTLSVWHPVPALATILAVGALLVAMARGTLMHLEHLALLRRTQAEALTDGLTGLPNRRALMEHLDAVLDPAEGGHRATLALFDLDGFKSYNDTFGHVAGDALLARLGARLGGATQAHGSAYRLGGDEFCVLLERRPAEHEEVVRRATEALCEHGDGFLITASGGRVRLPIDAATPKLALQLADERMYRDKDRKEGRRRGSPRRQARDLLLQVLREREPGLEEHVDDVGALAVAVGRHFGLDAESLDELARGAELHDVGKVAVPDTILSKPGPLDEVEWAIMRQHTIVGERILAAAPALRPVARLVRASHEQWDGGGYPDGLMGEEIPLGARIIAVCDAFDAMRQERPYAPTMSEDDALDELRRCAGTQFDPSVVEALAAVLAQGAGAALRVA